jgi:AGZA family xanthine/uracil permease-like MFS transporter
MTAGDCGSVCQLFFDNLSTLLGALFALQFLGNTAALGEGFAVTQETMSQIVWGQIVPGVGATMVFGNLFYTWQAIR